MEQVLYAKYNSLRRPEYRITTEIRENEQGLFVVKRAAEPAAEEHLRRIAENAKTLESYYRRIQVVLPQKLDGQLIFPLIQGESLMERVIRDRFEKDAFVRRTEEAFDLIFDIGKKNKVTFSGTEGFRKMFGNVNPGAVPAVCPANLDMILENFLEDGEGLHCIDCEWVCDFPVPVIYLKYRTLLYLFQNHLRGERLASSLEEYLGWFGFTPAEIVLCGEMEEGFQTLAHGENRKYRYTERYKKRTIPLEELMQQERNYQEISNAFFWKITRPARKLASRVRK